MDRFPFHFGAGHAKSYFFILRLSLLGLGIRSGPGFWLKAYNVICFLTTAALALLEQLLTNRVWTVLLLLRVYVYVEGI